MKRNTINAIIGKVQFMSLRAVRYTQDENTVYKFDRYITNIRRAAVKEMKRLMDDPLNKAFTEGYNAGFECAVIASNSIVTAQERFDEIEAGDIQPGNPSSLANDKPGAGLSFEPIAGIDFKSGVDGLFDAVKVICEDYNSKITKP